MLSVLGYVLLPPGLDRATLASPANAADPATSPGNSDDAAAPVCPPPAAVCSPAAATVCSPAVGVADIAGVAGCVSDGGTDAREEGWEPGERGEVGLDCEKGGEGEKGGERRGGGGRRRMSGTMPCLASTTK